MPIMFHVLDMIRVNTYLAYNSLVEEEEKLEQNYSVMEMVDKLLKISITLSYSYIRSVHGKFWKAINRTNRTLSKIGGGG